MFIYNYVAGDVDAGVDGDYDDTFDPHEHRKVPKPTTYGETMTHMLKGCLGAGLLAMPNAVSRMGVPYGAFGIIFIAGFATYCIQLLILAQYKVCKKWKRGYMSYPKTMRRAVQAGPPWLRWAAVVLSQGVDGFLVIWQFGICAIYLVFVGENTKQILGVYGHDMTVRAIICCCFPVALLMNFIKDLKLLTPFSSLSNACVILGLILVFFYIVEDDVLIDDEKFEFKNIGEIPVFIGITLFALEAVGVILALEYNMERPKEFTGICGLFTIGMCIITAIYVALGVFGYLKYGNEAAASITLNLPQHEKKAQVAKLTFAAALFLSYPLQAFVSWQILWRKIHKKFTKYSKVADFLLRIVTGTLPFCMAVAAPSLGAFMGLIGALCLTMVAVLYPAVVDLCVHYPNRYGFLRYKLMVDVFIIVFGAFCCCSGVYTSLLEMYEAYDW